MNVQGGGIVYFGDDAYTTQNITYRTREQFCDNNNNNKNEGEGYCCNRGGGGGGAVVGGGRCGGGRMEG